MASTSQTELLNDGTSEVDSSSVVSAVEAEDGRGRKGVARLDKIIGADRALADKFGYKPVRRCATKARRFPILIPMCRC